MFLFYVFVVNPFNQPVSLKLSSTFKLIFGKCVLVAAMFFAFVYSFAFLSATLCFSNLKIIFSLFLYCLGYAYIYFHSEVFLLVFFEVLA